jgi:SAM-dependent methyltransferase
MGVDCKKEGSSTALFFECARVANTTRSAGAAGGKSPLAGILGRRAMMTLEEQFGNIDIYLFDQLLKGRIAPGARILDAGCGYGRNLVYLLRQRFEVYGVDTDADSIAAVRGLAAVLQPRLSAENFRVEAIEEMTFPDAFFDVVVCNAVLHFSRNDVHFGTQMRELWRVLRPGSVFFCRLASTIGMDHKQMAPILGDHRFLSPDGAERFAVDEALLLEVTAQLGGQLLEPLKTTVVQDQRCMTTWVVRKND